MPFDRHTTAIIVYTTSRTFELTETKLWVLVSTAATPHQRGEGGTLEAGIFMAQASVFSSAGKRQSRPLLNLFGHGKRSCFSWPAVMHWRWVVVVVAVKTRAEAAMACGWIRIWSMGRPGDAQRSTTRCYAVTRMVVRKRPPRGSELAKDSNTGKSKSKGKSCINTSDGPLRPCFAVWRSRCGLLVWRDQTDG